MNGTSQAQAVKDAEKKAFADRYCRSVSRLGFRDADVSQRSGIPKNTISRYSNGLSLPDAKYVFALADVLKVNPRWLITGEGPRDNRDPGPTEKDPDGVEWQLMGLFRSLNAEGRAHLLSTARILWDGQIRARLDSHGPGYADQVLHEYRQRFKSEDGDD